MNPAVEKMRPIIETMEFKAPKVPYISGVDAQFHSDPDDIKRILIRQISSSVLWEDSMRVLCQRELIRSMKLDLVAF